MPPDQPILRVLPSNDHLRHAADTPIEQAVVTDLELYAGAAILNLMERLDRNQQARIANWTYSRWGDRYR